MCQLRMWRLLVVVRLDAISSFLIIPVWECLLIVYNWKCHGWLVIQKAVTLPQEKNGVSAVSFISLQ